MFTALGRAIECQALLSARLSVFIKSLLKSAPKFSYTSCLMLKATPIVQNNPSQEESLPAKDLSDAISLVNILFLTWKNYSLYPEGHTAVTKALENLAAAFEYYFTRHRVLRFAVKKNRLLCDTDVLHEVSQDTASEDLVSILYRDGIQWLEFLQGLSQDELKYFFTVLNKYRMLVEETEGDVVTGLTDGNLKHINFKAVDVFWENVPLIDFSSLNSAPKATGELSPDDVQALEEAERRNISAKSIADPSISETLWEISAAEIEEIIEMVRAEEKWDNTEDVLDVLLVILRSQTDQYSFSSVLDFTLEEAVEAIRQDEFELLLTLFQSLNQLLYRDADTELNWMRPLIDRFFQDLSHPEIFDLITGKLKSLNEGDTEKLLVLREVLLYFSPAIIHSLGPVILQTRFAAVQKMIMEVMEYMCLRDMSPMEILLDHPDKELGEMLLPLLSRLRGERSNRIFFKMSQHPSEQVRRKAARVLLAREPLLAAKLFPLIEDPSPAIRKDILAVIGKQKSSVLENMLLKYIQENADNKNTIHILSCYETLGLCGSDKVIPFLRKVLLDQGWNRFMGLGKPVHRDGAAMALALLDSKLAENILLAASKSRFQVIRDAYYRAAKKGDAPGIDPND